MNIQSINQFSSVEIKKRRIVQHHLKNKPAKTTDKNSDISEDRKDLIKKIKKKVKNGFYKSEAVNEDLSYDFARSLDQYI
ncbi:MAG TPA: hypothetical protein VKY57_05560 [Chitinispirillaceae bacterium]|jgi:hypothetical protein|nr:hypothetical protein [Chitinispirillaceae bacterium]